MKGLERFVELCMKTWPDERIGINIVPLAIGGNCLIVDVSRWRVPVTFNEHDLTQPHAMIRTIKSTMDTWQPIKA